MRNSLVVALMLASTLPAAAQTPYGAGPTAQLPPPPPIVLPPQPKPPKLEHLPKVHAEGLLGQPVVDAKGAVIGHVVNVLIDQSGKPKAAVVEFAGFLGVGDRKIAVAWSALHFSVVKEQIAIVVTLDAAKLKALPEYQATDRSVPVAVARSQKPPPSDTKAAP
ncbi:MULTISPECIES: PRC-barrel domain-containing protein [Acidiphilium]|uniref:PRC-barrel domain-containing protein n=1 Tax=Acidiphilium rubrum TaxID=526 RepID=A0A8G2FFC6_ACIRU|nr:MULTISPECIES: PRC-barrel domain-containing protein [Acidiphilium]SIQ20041.1 PRC-barrel domain-containing protein [Acidiphilium rubrum]